MLSAKRLVAVALALVLAGALWVRFGYEPDSGSHRITVEHVDASDGDFAAIDIAIEPVDGALAGLPPRLRRGWDEIGYGLVRSTPDAQPMTVDGQVGPRAVVNWTSAGPGTIRVSVDGVERETVAIAGADSGGVVLDFDLQPRLQSLLLLAVFFGWALFGVTKLAAPTRAAFSRWLPGRTVHRAALAVGVLASALLVIVIAPITRPAVVRYDMVVQPVETTQLAVTLETASGDVQQRRALDVSDGWSGSTGAVDTTANLPLHWTFVGSPDDRLTIDGFPLDAQVLVDVNGTRTETAAGPASELSLRELGSPVARLDRLILAASWLADITLLLALGVAVTGAIERWRRRRATAEGPAKSGVLYFAAFPMVVWTSLVVVFWPGMMNPDSVVQWRQLENGLLQDWHPYPVNVAWGLLQKIVDLPTLPILLVAGSVALLVGYVADRSLRTGAPRWAAWTIAIGVGVFPVTSILTVSLWKDILMGTGVLALTVALWRSEQTDSRWLGHRRLHSAFTVTACLTIWLSRHNGWPIAVLPLLAVLVLRPNARRAVAGVLLITVTVALFVRFPLKQMLDVRDSPVATIAILQRVAAHVEAGTEIPPEDQQFLESLRPLDKDWPYECQTVQTTWIGPESIPLESYVDEGARLREIWLGLALDAPGVELDHIACSSQILWRITDAGSVTYFIHGDTRPGFVDTIPTVDGTMPMEAHPSRELARRVFDAYEGVPSPLKRPALATYALFGLAAVVALRRRSLTPVIIISPAIVQTLTLIPTALVQDTRFQYGTVLVAVVACPLLLADLLRSRTGEVAHDARETTQPEPLPER
jgi:hypothetical protein